MLKVHSRPPSTIFGSDRGAKAALRSEGVKSAVRYSGGVKANAASLGLGLTVTKAPWVNTMSSVASEEGGGAKIESKAESGDSSHQAHSETPEAKPFNKIDPSASGEDITVIHAPSEFEEIRSSHSDQLVCLMCKALGCRPCKMFARKYQRVAASNKDSLFLEVTGDESTELRKLMIKLGIRATPTFKFFSNGECIHTHVGIDETKLRNAITKCQNIRAGIEEPTDGRC